MTVKTRYAKYPFFSDAKSFVAENYDYEEMIQRKEVKGRASNRVASVFAEDKERIKNKYIGDVHDDNEIELLSYPLARIYVSIIKDHRIINKYVYAETEAAVQRLEEDIFEKQQADITLSDIESEFGITINEADPFEVVNNSLVFERWEEMTLKEKSALASSAFNLDISQEDVEKKVSGAGTFVNEYLEKNEFEWYSVPVTDYLESTSPQHTDDKQKLANQLLANGSVILQKGGILEMLRHLVYERISEGLPIENIPENLESAVEEYVEKVESSIDPEEFTKDIDTVEEGLFPPVIKSMIDDWHSGKKLDHMERVSLASFLINIGMSDDEILELLDVKGTPGEQPTREQVEHLRSGEYVCPSYSRIKSYGYEWEEDALEQSVSHPLTYYRIKLEDSEEDEGELDLDNT